MEAFRGTATGQFREQERGGIACSSGETKWNWHPGCYLKGDPRFEVSPERTGPVHLPGGRLDVRRYEDPQQPKRGGR